MASSPQHEPTMEEILASIRKIISEDSTEAPAAPAPVAAAAAVPAQEADVLELTQEMPEEHASAPAAPVRAPVAVAKPESDVVFQTVEETTVATSSPVVHDDIFSDKTRKAFDDTFANIPDSTPARPSQRGPSTGLGGPDGSSVEAVFERAVTSAFDPVLDQWMDRNKADLLNAVKPLIREWMDEHFPALLEGAVRNEVERVVKARGTKR
jgi:uncharacterized protein